MTELEKLKLVAEQLYYSDQTIRRDCKIMVGLTKQYQGKLIIHVCGTKTKAIKHAERFMKKHKRECFIYDFVDYEERAVVKYTKCSFINPNLN